MAQGVTEITVTELEKTYTTSPESQITLMRDVAWYFDNVLVKTTMVEEVNRSKKSWIVTLVLYLFCGTLGAHHFYAGRIGSGITFLLTLGGLGIWALVDFILILTGNFKDDEGKVIK